MAEATGAGSGRGSDTPSRLRVDRWLWFSRIVKSRTLAQGLIKSGKVRVNGVRIASASVQVSPGDVLTITMPQAIRILEIVALGARRGPASEAQLLYNDRSPPPVNRKAPELTMKQGVREEGSGRPTKKERRTLDRFLARDPNPVDREE